jgi:hypothetical protein
MPQALTRSGAGFPREAMEKENRKGETVIFRDIFANMVVWIE